jgi:hypothetical protein
VTDCREDVLALAALRQTLVDAAKLAADDKQLRDLLARALAEEATLAKARLAKACDDVAVRN